MKIRLPGDDGEHILGRPEELLIRTGDPFLTDLDWLSPRFKKAIVKHQESLNGKSQNGH
jgi:hypothetical protein